MQAYFANGISQASLIVLLWICSRTVAAIEVVPELRGLEDYLTTSQSSCPGARTPVRVVAIGSSTMRGALGPMLRRLIQRHELPIVLENHGKSSTGLARPDFFDWHARAQELVGKGRPDLWLVALGTNDYQSVREEGKIWRRPPSEAWRNAYAERVRGLLEIMSGPDRSAAIIYLGSTPFMRPNSRRIGRELNKIIREEVERFDGPAVFYDIFSLVADEKNEPKEVIEVPQLSGKSVQLLGPDHIHLTSSAVRHLLAEPALRLIQACARQSMVGIP